MNKAKYNVYNRYTLFNTIINICYYIYNYNNVEQSNTFPLELTNMSKKLTVSDNYRQEQDKQKHGQTTSRGIATQSACNVSGVCPSVLSTPVLTPSNYVYSYKGDNTYSGQLYRNLFIVNDRLHVLQIAGLSKQIIASRPFNISFFIHNDTVVHLIKKCYNT